MTWEEITREAAKAEQERKEKRNRIEELKTELVSFDGAVLGGAVKNYLLSLSDKPMQEMDDKTAEAYCKIAEIELLELEC